MAVTAPTKLYTLHTLPADGSIGRKQSNDQWSYSQLIGAGQRLGWDVRMKAGRVIIKKEDKTDSAADADLIGIYEPEDN
jgi:hypothetical protein